MSDAPISPVPPAPPKNRSLRWWPLLIIFAVAAWRFYARVYSPDPNRAFQARNLSVGALAAATFGAVLLWWLFFSRVRWRVRWAGLGVVVAALGLCAALFRITGVSGDLVPIVAPRWAKASAPTIPMTPPVESSALVPATPAPDFPQFLGPDRNAILSGPTLATNWSVQSPRIVWRQPVGGAWSGFVISGQRALTQEQQGPEEQVTCYDLVTGRRLWTHGDPDRYFTTIAGEGPRATPTVVGDRVYTLGANGRLNALDLATGRLFWTHSITNDASVGIPEWGFSGSPLVRDGLVIVSAGGQDGKSLLAYRAETGERVWSGGSASAGYSSPFAATLGGVPQILLFNGRSVTAHDPRTGVVLWERPFGAGMPLVANPIVVGPERVIFSAGYNVGAELFDLTPGTNAPTTVWKSKKLKAKFSNPVLREGFVYGLDDGILACIDVKDGAQRWKEGRYGHGQGLLVGDRYLLMSEPGELILLRPTPDGANELARFPVFDAKTWNPIALSGDRLLVRNDREAALLILPLIQQHVD